MNRHPYIVGISRSYGGHIVACSCGWTDTNAGVGHLLSAARDAKVRHMSSHAFAHRPDHERSPRV